LPVCPDQRSGISLLESNLPRNSRLELIEADGHWE
jgi:hypothetical protein